MDHLSVPFETTILGVPVVVESLEISAAEHLDNPAARQTV
jgi:hypothetical protein